MDKEKIAFHIRGLLEAIGENPEREGLLETPERVANMLEEVLEGTAYTNDEIAEMFGKTFDSPGKEGIDNTVVMRDITVFSYCEHHLALMYDMSVNVAYIPRGKVLGLSKIARICDMAAAAGKARFRHLRDHFQGSRHAGRRRGDTRLTQLHDGARHPQRERRYCNNYLHRRVPNKSGIKTTDTIRLRVIA